MRLGPRVPRPELLAEALVLHQRLRFDPVTINADVANRLRSRVEGLRADLGKSRQAGG
jgi:hypothetical protein